MSIETDATEQKRKLKDLRAKVLFAWYTGIKNAKLYAGNHPSLQISAQRFSGALVDVFQFSLELSIRHSDGLFLIDEELFVEESLTMYDVLHILEEGKISQVLFLPGVQENELVKFISYISTLKGVAGQTQNIFSSEHIRVFPDTGIDLSRASKERTLERIQGAVGILDSWNNRTEGIFGKLIEEQALILSELADPLDELIDSMHRTPSLFSIGLSLPKKGDLHLRHAVHAMVMSVFLGQQLGLDMTSLKLLAICALCHDIGRQFLPSDFKTGFQLENSDVELVKLHARDGASFLSGVQGLPLTVVRVALEHHVGMDGLGYPPLPSTMKPHVFSQIVGLADFVSWQTISERAYHRPVSLSKLVPCLLRRSGTQFNPIMVKLLLPFLGFYPPGTKIQLRTGETAVCLEPNTRHVGRPAIAVDSGGAGKTYQWLSQISDSSSAFPSSVKKIIGQEENIAPLLPLIPNLFQTTT